MDKKRVILSVDTSTPVVSLALLVDGGSQIGIMLLRPKNGELNRQ
ncbi:MAG: hypothetical protein P8J64_00800 [Dehalococcoidia bacterium]|nr:hypothetical protein [Dehalococcoidia bacterium]